MNFLEDTMLMSYVLDAGKNKHNMDELSKIHLDHQTISYKDLVGTGKKQITFDDVGIERAKDYACLLYTSPSPRDKRQSRMPSSA